MSKAELLRVLAQSIAAISAKQRALGKSGTLDQIRYNAGYADALSEIYDLAREDDDDGE